MKLEFNSTSILPLILAMLFTITGSQKQRNGNCTWDPGTETLYCKHLKCCNDTTTSNSNSLGERFMEKVTKQFGNRIISRVRVIKINESFIPTINFNQFQIFPSLTNLSIRDSHICELKGIIPYSIKTLDLSYNVLMNKDFDPELFDNSSIEELNFSHNKLEQLPDTTFKLQLKKLWLIDNEIQCNWTTSTKFYSWASNNTGVIQDIDDTFCNPEQEVFAKITILSALKVRQTGLVECYKTLCYCDLWTTIILNGDTSSQTFPIVHSNKYGNVSLTLKFDCSNMSLTELPSISPFTVILSVDNNNIRDLTRLNSDPDYKNLNAINLNYNHIENFDSIINTPFFDRVHKLELRSNSITRISESTVNAIFAKNNKRIDIIAIGDNNIYCDCNTFTKLKSSFIAHESIFRDWKTIRCRSPNVTLHNLKYEDTCHIPSEENEWPWWAVAGVEVVFIVAVLGKLWRDRQEYRRTGILPMLSSCIPRLPCDFMLEGIKESNSHNHHNKI